MCRKAREAEEQLLRLYEAPTGRNNQSMRVNKPFSYQEIQRIKEEDGGGTGWGDHFLPHKFIERTFEHQANSTKQFLNAGRGHQAPRKAAHFLRKEVGQNIKDKKRDKRSTDEDPPRKGVFKKKFPKTRKHSHWWVCGEFWNLRGQHNQEEK